MRTSGLLALALVLQVLLARAVAIIPLVALSNAWRPPNCRLTLRQAAVIWWGGSMRGASELGRLTALLRTAPHRRVCHACGHAKQPQRTTLSAVSPAAASLPTPPAAVTVAMALKTFGRAGAQESVDNQIIVVASSAAVVISTGVRT